MLLLSCTPHHTAPSQLEIQDVINGVVIWNSPDPSDNDITEYHVRYNRSDSQEVDSKMATIQQPLNAHFLSDIDKGASYTVEVVKETLHVYMHG